MKRTQGSFSDVASIFLPGLNGPQGTDAAGNVIQVFGDFVAAGSLAVGLIIFVIIVVIQFVVITKGAGRISEVAARFTRALARRLGRDEEKWGLAGLLHDLDVEKVDGDMYTHGKETARILREIDIDEDVVDADFEEVKEEHKK